MRREPRRDRGSFAPERLLPLLAALTLLAAPSLANGVPAVDWWDRVQDDIVEAEYHVSWQEETYLPGGGAAWHAPNRSHGFRAYFPPEGVRLMPRTAEGPRWDWGLDVVAVVRGARAEALPAALDARAAAHRLERDRGPLVEWYVNTPAGLEQGFDLVVPPVADVLDEAPLEIRLALAGELGLRIAEDGLSADFTDAGGDVVLSYSGLLAWDATERPVAARMEPWRDHGRRGLRIVVDDRDAVYPLTIDPLITAPSWTAEGNQQADALFGFSATGAGDVNQDGFSDVIVGAPSFDNGEENEGRAYLYLGTSGGLTTVPVWTVEGNQGDEGTGAELGHAVATAGDVNGDGYSDVIIGAIQYSNGEPREGAAFVYLGVWNGLEPDPVWIGDSDQTDARFGYSVSTAGDVNGDGYSDVIVGARRYQNGQPGEGRAYLYLGSDTGPSPEPDWVTESDQTNSFYGQSVAFAGDVNGDGYSDVIVGAHLYDNPQADEGRAYVYHGTASGLSTTPSWIEEPDLATSLFGWSVSTAGDVDGDGYSDVIVGAKYHSNGQSLEGRAYVYRGSSSGLASAPVWSIESDQIGAELGAAVSTAGDVNGDGYADVLVGIPYYDNPHFQEGRAVVHHGSPTGPLPVASWVWETDVLNAEFGLSVAPAGDVNGDGFSDVIVGAPRFDNATNDQGKAFVFRGAAEGLALAPGWIVEGDQTGAEYGFSVAAAGDVDGDGFGDVVVGAPGFDNGEPDEGVVFVYLGAQGGPAQLPDASVDGGQANARFGTVVSMAGDVEGDGYEDVLVGTPQWHGTAGAGAGLVSVFSGSAAGLVTTASWTAEGTQAGAAFGQSVSWGGDVNADGFSDILIGAPLLDAAGADHGAAYAYAGSGLGLGDTPLWSVVGSQGGAQLGAAVAGGGDVNADGFTDVLVGAPFHDDPSIDEGRVFLYYGGATGPALTSAWGAEVNQAGAWFGAAVTIEGDFNKDSYSDIVVGAPGWDNAGGVDHGAAFMYLGSPTGPPLTRSWFVLGSQDSALYGASVAATGDLLGLGFESLLVGAPLHDNGQPDEGRVYLYHGSLLGLPTTASWTSEPDVAGAEFGCSTGAAGDVNGDGYGDIVIGARYLDSPSNSEGAAYLYFGNTLSGVPLRAQQRRGDGTAAVGPLSKSNCTDCFRLAAEGRTPIGRGRVKLEWEAKQFGAPLDGTNVESGASWIDSGTMGASLEELVEGLSSSAYYHWRMRLVYHVQTSPWQQRSRWFTNARNGWGRADVRLTLCQDDDGDGYGLFGTPDCPAGPIADCDDTNQDCTTDCTDGDGDGYCVTTDCDDTLPDCTTDCTDADADQFCVTTDCDDTRPNCTTDCRDLDGDDWCQGHDCNDIRPNCTTDCTDADGDLFCAPQDCNEGNSHCTSDCTDADGDGWCVVEDCNDALPNCTSDCTDADSDGFCVTTDCDEGNPHCTSSCADADEDGWCEPEDCDEANPRCTSDCTDVDGDGWCAVEDCNDALPNCRGNCTDVDGDGYCVGFDCSDTKPNCTTSCVDADQDQYCAPQDCNEANRWCNSDCTDVDLDGYCVTTDCDDTSPTGPSTFPGAAPADDPAACMKDSDDDQWGDDDPPAGVTPGEDCRDDLPGANPAVGEICNDGADNDCDGATDLDDLDCSNLDVSNLTFTSHVEMTWSSAPDADEYALYRGTIPGRWAGYNHLCDATELPSPLAVDTDVPLPREGFYYLATGLRIGNIPQPALVAGDLGAASSGALRPESSSITCGPRMYVDPDAIGVGDGLTWATAYSRVRKVLASQRFPDRGVEIWIKGTVPDPDALLDGDTRPGARILGGFDGTETAPWERSPATNPSVWRGTPGLPILRVAGADLAIDGVTLRSGTNGVQMTGEGNRVDLIDVVTEQLSGRALDLTATGGGTLVVQGSHVAGATGGIRVRLRDGTLGGLVRANELSGGSDAALRLDSLAETGSSDLRVDVISNEIHGAHHGVVLGAHVADVAHDATQASFLASNVIHHTIDDAVVVEASGTFATEAGAAAAVSTPLVVGNTISDGGGSGVVNRATRSDTTGNPAVHQVRAAAQLWDNLITFHAGPAIEESSDAPATNLVADPTAIGNGLHGSTPLYRDEGTIDRTDAASVNAQAEADDNFVSDPYYRNRAAGDYHIQIGTIVVAGFGQSMRYLANMEQPSPPIGMSWTAPGFDDTAWTIGEFGSGYDVGVGLNAQNLLLTSTPYGTRSIFVRVEFDVPDVSEIRNMFLGNDYDDGYVAWINGVEVVRSHEMPGGGLDWDTIPSLGESSNGVTPTYRCGVTPAENPPAPCNLSSVGIPLLQNGRNVLAIAVWNQYEEGEPVSSDLVLAPSLVLNDGQDNLAIDRGHGAAPRLPLQDIDLQFRLHDGEDADRNPETDVGADERQ
jgi:hypothetical protein